MRVNLVRLNEYSEWVPIPRAMLAECRLAGVVEVRVNDGRIILEPPENADRRALPRTSGLGTRRRGARVK